MSSLQLLAVGLGLLDVAAAACPTLQMFAARGTTEGAYQGAIFANAQGLLGFATSNVLAQVPGSATTGVQYPASGDFLNSEREGVGNLTMMLMDFSTECPDSYISVLGYSQGAQVVSDVLCGPSLSNTSTAIDLKYTRNLIAAVTVADPTNTNGLVGVEKFGNSTRSGPLARTNLTQCAAYSGRYATWCQDNDQVCDGGGTSFIVHVEEIIDYQFEIADWIVSRYYEVIGQPDPYYSSISGTTSATKTVAPVTITQTEFSVTTSLNPGPVTSSAMTTSTNLTSPYHNMTSTAAPISSSTTNPPKTTSTVQTAAALQMVHARMLICAGAFGLVALLVL